MLYFNFSRGKPNFTEQKIEIVFIPLSQGKGHIAFLISLFQRKDVGDYI